MYLKLLEDEEIVSSLEFQNVFKVDIDKPLIKIEAEDNRFLYLTIFAFLNLLRRLVKKGLRKGFFYKNQKLNGRIKGKLDIKLTTQRLFSKSNYTQAICKFEILTEDILENQILKTALIQVEKFLKRFPLELEEVSYLIGYLKVAFGNVTTTKVYERDFLKVKTSPFFSEYKKALNLARIILKNLGSDPFASFKGVNYITPYIVNMPKLFELFVWKNLKEKYGNNVKYQIKIGSNIPDFVIKGHNLVIDAKYKYLDLKGVSKEDISQLSRYGRNIDIRILASGFKNKEPQLGIIYPTFEKDTEKKAIENYYEFFIQGLEILHIS